MVLQTRNYQLFKPATGNRQLYEPLIKRLAKEFRDRGFSDDFPILVRPLGKEFVVIDGQHRLAAAALAGVGVKYKMTNENEASIPKLNSVLKSWAIKDFVNYWAAHGRNPYQKVLELSSQFKMDVSTISVILSQKASNKGMSSGAIRERLKDGSFSFTPDDLENFHFTIEKVNEIRFASPLYEEFHGSSPFIKAILRLVCASGYNHEKMMNAIKHRQSLIVKCTSINGYIILLEQVYNWKTRSEGEKIWLI